MAHCFDARSRMIAASHWICRVLVGVAVLGSPLEGLRPAQCACVPHAIGDAGKQCCCKATKSRTCTRCRVTCPKCASAASATRCCCSTPRPCQACKCCGTNQPTGCSTGCMCQHSKKPSMPAAPSGGRQGEDTTVSIAQCGGMTQGLPPSTQFSLPARAHRDPIECGALERCTLLCRFLT
jgi:hypothetical protein